MRKNEKITILDAVRDDVWAQFSIDVSTTHASKGVRSRLVNELIVAIRNSVVLDVVNRVRICLDR